MPNKRGGEMKKICPFSLRGDEFTHGYTYGYLSKTHMQVECIGQKCAAWGFLDSAQEYEGCKIFRATEWDLDFEDNR